MTPAMQPNSQGARITEVLLEKGHDGLHKDGERAEGIARDCYGMLYICSEPNEVYRFRPTGQQEHCRMRPATL